jgi:hypothetical protein
LKKLVSSTEAAQILGISLQGIHYRIKKGQLQSKKQDGKTFVYVDSSQVKSKDTTTAPNDQLESLNKLAMKSKDEQIELLKKTIKFVKKQHNNEIERLEKSQDKILNVFQSEVDLLKSAFHEMKNIYQIEHIVKKEEKQETKTTEQPTSSPDISEVKFMDIKEFFILMKSYNKSDIEIKNIILDRVKSSDKRFIYKRETKEVLIFKSDFLDLL